jgi:hypothetical protein
MGAEQSTEVAQEEIKEQKKYHPIKLVLHADLD